MATIPLDSTNSASSSSIQPGFSQERLQAPKFSLSQKKRSSILSRLWRRSELVERSPSHRPTTRLTREGYQFVFLLMFVWLAAILQNINLLVLLAGAFCAMLLVQWRLASGTLWGLTVQRYVPLSVQARKQFTVQLMVTNPRRRLGSWMLMIHETFVAHQSTFGFWQPGHGLTLLMNHILPLRSSSTTYQCVAPRRGVYRFEPTELSTRFPFTLMRGRLVCGERQSVNVHPTVGKLKLDWRKSLGLPQIGKTKRSSSMSGGDGEFYGLRAYRAGDTPRWIHWRTSAKRNELLVRQFEREEKQSLVVILDLKFGSTHNQNQPQASDVVDTAVEIFSTIVWQLIVQDRSYATVSVLDQKPSPVHQIKTTHHVAMLMDRLSNSNPPKTDILSDTLRLLGQRNVAGEPILVISVRDRPEWLVKSSHNSNNYSEWRMFSPVKWLSVSGDEWKNVFERG